MRVVRGNSPVDSDGNSDGVGQKVRHVRATEYERSEEETRRWGYVKRWFSHMSADKGSKDRGKDLRQKRVRYILITCCYWRQRLSDQDHLQEEARGLLMATVKGNSVWYQSMKTAEEDQQI